MSSAKAIYFLKRMPSLASLKKTLNRKCSNNVSFRSSIYLPSPLSRYGPSLSFIMILGLVSNPCDNKSTYGDFIGLMSKYQGKTYTQNFYIALAFKYCVSLLTVGMAVLRNTSLLDWALDLTEDSVCTASSEMLTQRLKPLPVFIQHNASLSQGKQLPLI